MAAADFDEASPDTQSLPADTSELSYHCGRTTGKGEFGTFIYESKALYLLSFAEPVDHLNGFNFIYLSNG